jgi:hypothetical protein
MRRKEWFELHDHRLYPGFLRDLVTDALEGIWNCTDSYQVIVPRLRAAMEDTGTRHIVDLCSGGGGPWSSLHEQFATTEEFHVSISLTDKFPNQRAVEGVQTKAGIKFYSSPVDARRVPADLDGFRTIFSTFHHFNPEAARAILADAVMRQQGIAVFEAPRRSIRTMIAMAAVPPLCWYVTPRLRPFRWSRFFWTYLLPVVPFTLFVDGVLSCLRSYSLEDFRELIDGLGGDEYRWELGEEHSGRIGIAYLIGRPIKPVLADEELVPAALSAE